MSDIMEREWLDVSIISTYVDRGNVIQQEVQVLRSEAEAEMIRYMQHNAPDEDFSDYKMPNHEFQGRVMRAIQTKLGTPIQAKSNTTNEMRLLPPTAYREVIVRVNNLGKILEA